MLIAWFQLATSTQESAKDTRNLRGRSSRRPWSVAILHEFDCWETVSSEVMHKKRNRDNPVETGEERAKENERGLDLWRGG
jgi:hypothetical protein